MTGSPQRWSSSAPGPHLRLSLPAIILVYLSACHLSPGMCEGKDQGHAPYIKSITCPCTDTKCGRDSPGRKIDIER